MSGDNGSSGGGSGCGCGCIPLVAGILVAVAVIGGLPTSWGTLHIDFFPPGVYMTDVPERLGGEIINHTVSTPGTIKPDNHVVNTPGKIKPDNHVVNTPGTIEPSEMDILLQDADRFYAGDDEDIGCDDNGCG